MSMEFTGHAKTYLTARDNDDRIAAKPDLIEYRSDARFSDNSQSRVWLDPKRRFQTIQGFGGAFTEAAATVWAQLNTPERQAVLQDYFHPELGHGYRFCRVHMGSCDFSLGNYSHANLSGDFALESFSIERDQQALIPFIKAATQMAGHPLQLLASPWSPPAWMKTNGQMNGGGQLKAECAAAWAQYFIRFIQAYAAEGIPIWGVTVQNEPQANQVWDSCIYSAAEERDFIRDHLGPALASANLSHIRIVAWDHNRDEMVERASVIFSDTDAANYVWGTGFHWYGENHFDHVQMVHDAWPDKHLLFTEGCQEGGPRTGEWELGERYARSIINDLNRWTVGWIDWNLLLDATGGPNHVGNLCSAPMLAVVGESRILKQNSFDYLGHFSRFISVGAQRIVCAANREVLECCAFINPDESIVLVVLNRSDEDHSFQISLNDQQWATAMPARSIRTVVF
jgi:glucosylceramidase